MGEKHDKNGHQFYKVSGCGSVYSLIDRNGLLGLDAVLLPEPLESCALQLESILSRLSKILKKERMFGSVIYQNVFLRNKQDQEWIQPRLREYFGDYLPAVTYVPQTPCSPGVDVIFEVHALLGEHRRIRVIRHGEQAVTVEHSEISLGYFGGFEPNTAATGAYDRSLNAFQQMADCMRNNGFSLSDTLRTWIYQGHIVLPEGTTQRYKELNRARTDFFAETRFLASRNADCAWLDSSQDGKSRPVATIYPASTGIGADDMDVRMSAIGIKTSRPDVRTIPLENPGQTPAFDYGAVYSPQSPKFSRAMAVAYDGECSIYVSGTASIVDSETVFAGDPERQTEQTLENIRALISGSNLKRHGLSGFVSHLCDLVCARVYVKRAGDYEKIRAICEKRLGNTPVVYTISDVCRDDLLVEVEGIVLARHEKKDANRCCSPKE